MATYYCLTSTSLHSHSSSSSPSKTSPTDSFISSNRCTFRKATSFLNSPLSSSSPSFILSPKNPAINKEVFTVSALVDGEQQEYASTGNGYSLQEDSDFRNSFKPYELYVCNLPRSYGILELFYQFSTFGIVQSLEVSRNPETGVSRGCGYVTMSSLQQAKSAICALDGSDADGREMRVRFSSDMNSKWGNEGTGSRPQKNLVFESPYKVYAGNLSWSVKPEDLRNHFSRFGNVISTTVLHDRKGGKNRVYGFLSFSTPEELEAAMSLNETEFYGRILKLREVIKWPEQES